jgi:hypothetical protein
VVPPRTRSIGLIGSLVVRWPRYLMHWGYGKSHKASNQQKSSLLGDRVNKKLCHQVYIWQQGHLLNNKVRKDVDVRWWPRYQRMLMIESACYPMWDLVIATFGGACYWMWHYWGTSLSEVPLSPRCTWCDQYISSYKLWCDDLIALRFSICDLESRASLRMEG